MKSLFVFQRLTGIAFEQYLMFKFIYMISFGIRDGEMERSCPGLDINRPVRQAVDCWRSDDVRCDSDIESGCREAISTHRTERICWPTLRNLRN